MAGAIAQVERRIEPMIEESKMIKLFAVLALLATGLAACGGGGGGNNGGGGGGGSGSTAPTITSANSTTFTEGTASTFTVTATGSPAPTITESGTLPAGVTFTAPVLSGTATVSGTFPLTFTASNGVSPNASQSFTLTVNASTPPPPVNQLIQLNTISEMAGNPFDQITISGTNFNEGTEAISVIFTPENGDPIQIIATVLSSADQVSVMIPPFFNSTGTATAETVDVRVLAFDSTTTYVSSVITGLSVATLPTVSGAQPGAVTAALLTASQNIALSVQSVASSSSTYDGFVIPLGQLNTDTGATIAALANLNRGSISVATQGGGTTTITAAQIAQADQIAQALVASFVAQAEVPIVPSTSSCPAATGDLAFDSNLCSIQQYFQNMVGQNTPDATKRRRMSAEKIRAEMTKAQSAGATFGLNLSLGVLASFIEPPAGLALAYELIAAPVASTMISSFVVNQEIPSTTDAKLGVGFAVADKVLFKGMPVFATTWDELQVLYGYFSDGPPSPDSGQIPNGGFVWDFGGTYQNSIPSQLKSWNAAGQPINENIGLPEWPTGPSGVDSTQLVLSPSPVNYSLTVGAGVGGTVGVVPSGTLFAAGTSVTVIATANSGFTFANWTGACAGQGSSCTLTMNSDLVTNATFTPNTPPPPPPSVSDPTGVYVGNFTVTFQVPMLDNPGETAECKDIGTVTWYVGGPQYPGGPLSFSIDWIANYFSGDYLSCGQQPYTDDDVVMNGTYTVGANGLGVLQATSNNVGGWGFTYNATFNTAGIIFGSTTNPGCELGTPNAGECGWGNISDIFGYSPYELFYQGPLPPLSDRTAHLRAALLHHSSNAPVSH